MLWELPERFDFSRRELSIDALRMQHGVYRARWRRLFGMRGWFVQRADGVIWMHRVWGGDVLDVGGRDFQQHLRVLSCRCLVAARERDVIELQMQYGLYRVRRECVHEVRLGNIQE